MADKRCASAGVDRADDPVSHLVASRELRVGIPDISANDPAAEWLRDAKGVRKLLLRDAGLSARSDFTNEFPIQLCASAWRLVLQSARVQQSMLLRLGDAALAVTHDKHLGVGLTELS